MKTQNIYLVCKAFNRSLSKFDMVQHVEISYDICVIRVTLTVWYCPACETLVWYLCDTINTYCLIWSSMWNSRMIFVWYMQHLLFDMVQHVNYLYNSVIIWVCYAKIIVRVLTNSARPEGDMNGTYCFMRSRMWNSCMIIVWYRLHSLFDMVQHVNHCNLWFLCDTDDTHCLIWSSMLYLRMIFVWYGWHSLFDMVQHVIYHNLWYLCDVDDTHCLIWSSMWTTIIYDFCVIQMTFTVWYGPACELLYSMIFVWYRWHSLFDMVQHVNYRNLWFLCDMDDTHCLIWSSMLNSFLLRPLVLHRSIRSSSRWLVMMTSWRNFRVWVCIWKFLMRRRNIWGRSDEQAKSPTQTDSEYMTTSLLNQTDERISWLVFASHYSEYTPFRWPSTWSPWTKLLTLHLLAIYNIGQSYE